MKKLWILLFAAFIMSCQSNSTQNDAPTADDMENDLSNCDTQIEPYFDSTYSDLILTQSFERFTAHTIEKVSFKNGVELELRQSGCKIGKQRYQLTLPNTLEDSDNAIFWSEQASQQFNYLLTTVQPSTAAENVFNFYTSIFSEFKDQIPLNEMVQATPDAAIQLEKFVQEDGKVIIVVEGEFLG